MKKILVTGMLLVVVTVATAKDFDAAEFGAVNDGKTDSTAAIQKAIDACAASGGGTARVSGGGVYLTYTLYPKSNVRFEIVRGTTIKGGPDPLKYPEFEETPIWNVNRTTRFNKRALIYACGAENFEIGGGGVIDGSAEDFHELRDGRWQRKSNTLITGRCVMLAGCKDVRLDDFTIRNPSGWSTWILACDRVNITRLRIETNRMFPNGDGIHLGNCQDVAISDCFIDSQDDALIFRSFQEQLFKPRPLARVTVNNCILRSNHASMLRIGWTEDFEMRDCVLSNIISPYSALGIQIVVPPIWDPVGNLDPPRSPTIKGPPAPIEPFAVENIRFSNISMVSGFAPLEIVVTPGSPFRHIKDLSFSDMKIISTVAPQTLILPEHKVSGIHFNNVDFDIRHCKDEKVPGIVRGIRMKYADAPGFGNPATFAWFRHCTDVDFNNVRIRESEGEPLPDGNLPTQNHPKVY